MKNNSIAEDMLMILNADSNEESKLEKFASALESLNQAAELLDNLNQNKYSELITKIIENSNEFFQ